MLPKGIRVGSLHFSIEVKKISRKWYGLSHHGTCKIELREGISESQLRDTLLHEIMHCCLHNLGIGFEDADKEEKLIQLLCPMLLATLQNNPDVEKYLMEKEDA